MTERPRSREAARLRAAASDLSLVRVRRGIAGADRLEGFVLALSDEWVLLRLLDPAIRLDGYAAIRAKDIRRVRTPAFSQFVRAALELRAQWPPNEGSPALDLDSDQGLITTAGTASSLVTIHIEYERPDVCFIGRPAHVTAKRVDLHEVTPEAIWLDGGHRLRFREISRVDVGGAYEEALNAVAGPPPPL